MDTPKEAVEHVAKALYRSSMRLGMPDWQTLKLEQRSTWRHRARVAIKAIAEFTPPVVMLSEDGSIKIRKGETVVLGTPIPVTLLEDKEQKS